MRSSGQPGPPSASSALSRIWACLILRTSALPRASSRSSSSRSSAVSVTRYFLVMTASWSASLLTRKRSDHHLSPDKALEDFQLNPDRAWRGESAGVLVRCNGCAPGSNQERPGTHRKNSSPKSPDRYLSAL